MIEAEFWDYDDAGEMADAVAGDIGFIIDSAVEARGEALVAFPGGKTPLAIFERLAAAKLPWKRVTIIPTDDRLVALDNPLSNARLLAQHFLKSGARVYPYTPTGIDDVALVGNSADARLKDLKWPLDLAWLGMGGDGHTASIFAGPNLKDALDAPKGRYAVGVTPDPLPPEAPVPRVTLTRSAILAARTILITISGDDKRKLLERAIADGPSSTLPIGRVLADAEQPIDIHWSN